jgi:hypothetical protein
MSLLLDPLSTSIPLSDALPSKPDPSLPKRKLLTPSPDHPDDYILEIDYSNISEFINCPRRAENKIIYGREANKPNSATEFGDLFHRCESLRLEHGWTPEVKTRQYELVADHFITHRPAINDHRTSARMIDTLDMYNKRWENDGWPQKVYFDGTRKFVEVPFKVALCTIPVDGRLPYPRHLLLSSVRPDIADVGVDEVAVRNIHVLYCGKIDVVLHDSNLFWIVDHKTSSRGGDQFVKAFNLSLQTRGYCWAAQKVTGLIFAGLIINALIIRPLTKTGKGTDLDRHTYFYDADRVNEFQNDITYTMVDFVNSLKRGFFPQHGLSFISPCEMCDYEQNCRLPLDQRATDLRSDIYRDVTWNPMH